MLHDGGIFTHDGHTFRFNVEEDDSAEAPWDHEHWHGPVSEWTTRDAEPAELVLHDDSPHRRYYDVPAALEMARKDNWGLFADDAAALARKLGREPTKREIRTEAVRLDFERLRAWCNDEWRYIGVIVTHLPEGYDDGRENDYGNAVWGIEEDAVEYLVEVAHELAGEVAHDLDAEAKERSHWENQGVPTRG